MGGREVGGVPGDISGSGVFLWDFRGGRWRVWEKPCTDPSVDKRSRERSPLSLSVLPPCLSLSFFPSLFLPRRSNDFESKSHPIFQGEGGEEG